MGSARKREITPMPDTPPESLTKAISRLETTVVTLTTIANSITYEMQANNFRILQNEKSIKELMELEAGTGNRLDNLDRVVIINTGKFDAALHEIRELRENIKDIKTHMKNELVTKDQFSPIQKIIYAVAGIALTAVMGAIFNIVIIKP
jgi:DNA repair exonuclease SbcCD ATPase subunit